jgi:hypothetical protein
VLNLEIDIGGEGVRIRKLILLKDIYIAAVSRLADLYVECCVLKRAASFEIDF